MSIRIAKFVYSINPPKSKTNDDVDFVAMIELHAENNEHLSEICEVLNLDINNPGIPNFDSTIARILFPFNRRLNSELYRNSVGSGYPASITYHLSSLPSILELLQNENQVFIDLRAGGIITTGEKSVGDG